MQFNPRASAVGVLLGFVALMAMTSSIAAAQELRWKTVEGILRSGDKVGVGRGKLTGGIPWVTSGGSVDVNLDTGSVSFDVKGLVLAVGSDPLFGFGVPIGTPGPVTQVQGTLVCDVDGTSNGGNSLHFDTPATTLDSEGNAQFSGSFISSLPSICSSEKDDDAFVIRIVQPAAVAGAWIAFGAVRSSD
jgi:hypothetical protein